MSDCRRIVEQLASYSDGELPSADRAGVEQHLDRCPPCRRAAAASSGGRQVLRRVAPSLRGEPLPPGLYTRCEAIARAHGRPQRSLWARRLAPALVTAAIIVVTASILLALATRRSDALLAGQLAFDHAKCWMLPPHGEADASATAAMLHARYGWNVRVPPSSPGDGLTLLGARRCLYADGTIPHVMYRMGGEDLSLYVLDGVRRRDADVSALGHRARIWSEGNTTYVVVSARAGVDLDRAVRVVSRSGR